MVDGGKSILCVDRAFLELLDQPKNYRIYIEMFTRMPRLEH